MQSVKHSKSNSKHIGHNDITFWDHIKYDSRNMLKHATKSTRDVTRLSGLINSDSGKSIDNPQTATTSDENKKETSNNNRQQNANANGYAFGGNCIKSELKEKTTNDPDLLERELIEWLLKRLIENMEDAVREISVLMNDSYARFTRQSPGVHKKAVKLALQTVNNDTSNVN